jgi:RNA polymerase sigma-70 factor (ECF subfamily)
MADGPERRDASDDLALVRRVLRGDRGELALLAERLRCIPRALQLLDRRNGRLLGPEELADLVQDVLVLAWRKLGEYEGLSSLEGWAYGMCALEYRNALRRGRRLRQEARAIASRAGAPVEAARDPDPWAFEEVHEGLRRIGREEAQVIRLKHFEGRTFEEIGRGLGLSPNTVKTRYYRGLQELRALLERRGEPFLGGRA